MLATGERARFVRQRRCAVLRAVPGRHPQGFGPHFEHERYEALVKKLLQLDKKGLTSYVACQRGEISSNFFLWLAKKQEVASEDDKKRLASLGGTLLFLQDHYDHQPIPLRPQLGYLTRGPYRSSETVRDLHEGAVHPLPNEQDTGWQKTACQGAATSRGNQEPSPTGIHQDGSADLLEYTRWRLLAPHHDAGAADKVLDELLNHMASREERSIFFPEAFSPPGLQVEDPRGGANLFVCTQPQSLLDAIRDRLARVVELLEVPVGRPHPHSGEGHGEVQGGIGRSPSRSGEAFSEVEFLEKMPTTGYLYKDSPALPSGELLVDVLRQLEEDVLAYDLQVYQGKTRLEKLGGVEPISKMSSRDPGL